MGIIAIKLWKNILKCCLIDINSIKPKSKLLWWQSVGCSVNAKRQFYIASNYRTIDLNGSARIRQKEKFVINEDFECFLTIWHNIEL